MTDHTPILMGALIDYTEWLLKQVGPAGSPNDLKGIFYNKLITRLRPLYTGGELYRSLDVGDIYLTLSPSGMIVGVSFREPVATGRPYDRQQLLMALRDAASKVDVKDCHSRLSYELTKIISELVKP